jgi:hypothetical protein
MASVSSPSHRTPPTNEQPASANGIQGAIQWFLSDSTSLIAKIGIVACACFAMIALGGIMGQLTLAIVVAVVIVGGGGLWMAAKKWFDTKKNPAETDAKPIDAVPNERTKTNEESHRVMIEALGGDRAFNTLPIADRKGSYVEHHNRPLAKNVGGAITKGVDGDGVPIVMFKLQRKNGGHPFITTFARPLEDKHGFRHWFSNVDHPSRAPASCFPSVTIVNESIVNAILQLREGTHPEYELVR